jgi:serine/threonine-protein kinase
VWTPLFRGGHHAHYVSSGHLVYAAQGTLRAVAFDLDTLSLRGPSALVVPRLVTTGSGAADFSVSTDGTLVYLDGPADVSNRTLVWVDRQGQEARLGAPPRAYQYPRLSADGGSVSLEITGQGSWVWDLQNSTLRRRDEGAGQMVSTPAGPRVVFGSGAAALNLFLRTADGAGTPVRLTESPNCPGDDQRHARRSSDLSRDHADAGRDLPMVHAEPGAAVEPLLATPADERSGMVSPGGRWLAYESDRSGRFEVWVGPFPNVADRWWQVSTDGGRHPAWSHDGRELFFVTLDGLLVAVPVDPREAVWNAGTPQRLFDRRYYTGAASHGSTTSRRMANASSCRRRGPAIGPWRRSRSSSSRTGSTSSAASRHCPISGAARRRLLNGAVPMPCIRAELWTRIWS